MWSSVGRRQFVEDDESLHLACVFVASWYPNLVEKDATTAATSRMNGAGFSPRGRLALGFRFGGRPRSSKTCFQAISSGLDRRVSTIAVRGAR